MRWGLYAAAVAVIVAAIVMVTIFLTAQPTANRVSRSIRGTMESVACASDEPMHLKDPIPYEIDGVKVEKNMRFILMGQDHAVENGVYTARARRKVPGKLFAKRAKDMNSDKHVMVGATVLVRLGNKYGGTTLVTQVQQSDGAEHDGISEGIHFVSELEQLLGSVERRHESVLVSSSRSYTGVEWRPIESVREALQPAKREYVLEERFEVSPGEKASAPIGRISDTEDRIFVVELSNGSAFVGRMVPGVPDAYTETCDLFGTPTNTDVGVYAHKGAHYLTITRYPDDDDDDDESYTPLYVETAYFQ